MRLKEKFVKKVKVTKRKKRKNRQNLETMTCRAGRTFCLAYFLCRLKKFCQKKYVKAVGGSNGSTIK